MRRKPWHYAMLGALAAVGVLYGIELSSDGIEDSYGPIGRTAAVRQADPYGYYGPYTQDDRYGYTARRQSSAYDSEAYPYDGRTNLGARPSNERDGYGASETPDIDAAERPARRLSDEYVPSPYDIPPGGGAVSSRLADGTAGLLQSAADEGIKLVVSFFEAITK